MARKEKTKAKAPAPQGSDMKGESGGLLHGLITVLLSLLIVLVVFGGAFYYVLKKNMYGLGERFRPSLERIPVIKLALPPLPETEDPDDPKHLTQKELLDRYNAYRKDKAALEKLLADAEEKILALEEEKNQWVLLKEKVEAQKLQNEKVVDDIKKQTKQLEADREEFARIVAEKDPKGFTGFFEKMNAKTAEMLYKDLKSSEIIDDKLKSQSKTFEEMDPEKAAKILTQMSENDRELLIDIIRVMKSDVAAEIIENMDPEFAVKLIKDVTDKALNR